MPIFFKYSISVRHALILCNIVGNTATQTTSLVLITVDFSFNIYLCLRIIWLRRQQPNIMLKQIECLQDLALYELVEFQVPLAFISVLCVTYYGPNGALYGNILNSYWTFAAIEDIGQTMTSMATFFIIDFASTVISAFLLWFFCGIKLWEAFLGLQEEFGKAFCIMLSSYLVLVIR